MIVKSKSSIASFLIGAACVSAPLAIGMISAGIAGDQMKSFGELNQPPLSPPAWLFPVVWTVLYVLMGIALLMILHSKFSYKPAAIVLFVLQLVLNFFWSPVFFVEKAYTKALVILLLMLAATVILAVITWRIRKPASIMLFPYIVWMLFATYLNAGVGILNQ